MRIADLPPYVLLGMAIVFEMIGTTAIKATEGFTKLVPSIITLAAYGMTMWLFSMTLKSIPTGVAYAIWSGIGIVLISVVSFFVYKQSLDVPAIIGIALIIAGVVVINLFSHTVQR